MKKMSINFIGVRIKDKTNININDNKSLELFKLSLGNKITNLNYNKNNKEYSNKNFEIIYYKKFIQKNIGKMIYKRDEYRKYINIVNEKFILNNMKRTKIIINNKQNDLKGNIENEKQNLKIKIKFLDNIIYLESMFKDCRLLSSVNNFKI